MSIAAQRGEQPREERKAEECKRSAIDLLSLVLDGNLMRRLLLAQLLLQQRAFYLESLDSHAVLLVDLSHLRVRTVSPATGL